MLKEYQKDIFEVHKKFIQEYLKKLPEGRERQLALKFLESENMPSDKQGRWFGFIQACIIRLGLSTVEIERNRTRDSFHEVYRKYGLSTETISVE